MTVGLAPALAMDLRKAVTLMDQRRFAEARLLLEAAVRSGANQGDARYLLGATLRMLGDLAGAERELRGALTLDPIRQDAALELARLLNGLGRHQDVVVATDRAVAIAQPRVGLLAERAKAFQALERMDECLAERERAVALQPGKSATLHNLAAALGDAGEAGRAEMTARAALAAGGEAPETWLVLARALQAQNRFDDAQAAFGAALARRPDYAEALRDLAQLVWMRTGDLGAASAVLPAGQSAPLRLLRARLHEYAGDIEGGYRALTVGPVAGDAVLEITAAHLAAAFDPELALTHALRAETLAPGAELVVRKAIDAHLAAGLAEAALVRIEAARAQHPLDQGLLAAQWTAWRMLDDPRAAALYDYDAFVADWPLDTPDGWTTLDSYLADLTVALAELHGLHTHPLDQSLRHGTQTSANLLRSEHPAIQAFSAAIDGPIRRHMAFLGAGADPVRARNTGGYRIKGMWSVRLRPGGFHVNHVHPQGWLSSACYIELPAAVDAGDREGWLQFGQAGVPTPAALEPEHFIRPQAGRLALFPSYMWHGTAPFSGEGRRLTIAFDVLPA
ncbi:MAG: tetratricopeptide repeat protein [Alphaproteobacteria bacterium]|nr:tetratricopeptide repeat protein [Alphaproteobacteria bacterium]MBU1516911.1 tetratricopeptide repeat protein [Alphaproteobacteria bacterium]MBU2092606.1 tetratricopeptide repeat protein [Alphaproteobacteria bacterium]MBU2151283.1 tetratricopeptide repeat protein [Alphaproteobacteria bacterium]MBU2309585.1 tetratricopeptide repeat protein [Alphaproteobacteria bacterium]